MKIAGTRVNHVGRRRNASQIDTVARVSAAISWFAVPNTGQMIFQPLG